MTHPQRTITRQTAREVDRRAIDDYRMTGLMLMENAARGCVDQLLRLNVSGPIVICCGKGNNGGDGFAMARRLDLLGFAVRVAVLCNPAELSGDAAVNFTIINRANLAITVDPAAGSPFEAALAGAAWIVDALLGTGARGALRPPLDRALARMNAASARKLAVDLPSGLDCDTGVAAEGAFRADHTCTFVAAKAGFSHPAAAKYTGVVQVVDIGAPRQLIDEICS